MLNELLKKPFTVGDHCDKKTFSKDILSGWPKNVFADYFVVRFDVSDSYTGVLRQDIFLVDFDKDICTCVVNICKNIIVKEPVEGHRLLISSILLDTDNNIIIVKF